MGDKPLKVQPDLDSVKNIVSGIGVKLRKLRTEHEMSLNHLAVKAGISPAAIHKIEKGTMVPSVTLLMKLARALGKSTGYFINEENTFFEFKDKVEVVRKTSRTTLNSPSGAQMEVLAMTLEQSKMEACIFTFDPGAKSGMRSDSHKGEEFFLVLSGELSFVVEDELYILGEGDSIHFNSEFSHRWENTGNTDLKFLWVMTPLPLSSLGNWIP